MSGAPLADELTLSLRTVYRDIHTLIASGAPIEGEAGICYVLRAGFTAPPLMFSDEEVEAIVVGSRMVVARGGDTVAWPAWNALAMIATVMLANKRENAAALGLFAGPSPLITADGVDLASVRGAIRDEQRVPIGYGDGAEVVRHAHQVGSKWPKSWCPKNSSTEPCGGLADRDRLGDRLGRSHAWAPGGVLLNGE